MRAAGLSSIEWRVLDSELEAAFTNGGKTTYPWGDDDLGSPNQAFGGPGVGAGT